ncbi:hypothetical protein LCGC14_1059550 [marine sediment metagenome]|uniref:Uncharacterized protein n=1 Tax=marine sediment metagenome TaxID=412755 RepID=A0A0F9QSB1_9ZZZZ
MKCRINGIACQGDWLAQNGDCDEGPDKGCLYEELSILSKQLAEYRDAEKFVADPPHDQECCGCAGILRKQLTEAEREVERLRGALGMDSPWSVISCIDTLIDAVDILLFDCNYDGHGYETIGHAKTAARKHMKELSKVLAEQALKPKELFGEYAYLNQIPKEKPE